MPDLKPGDIQEILRIFAESELEELRLEVGGTRLHVTKSGNGLVTATSADPGPRPVATPPPPPVASAPTTAGSSGAGEATAAPPTAGGSELAAAQPAEGLHELRSPLLGVFYRRPSPDQPPFVDVGATVGPDDPVCIVDVMKMFTRVQAGVSGRIAEILAEDGQLVEHGQVLMRIELA